MALSNTPKAMRINKANYWITNARLANKNTVGQVARAFLAQFRTHCIRLLPVGVDLTKDVAKFSRWMDKAVSTAPPPGTTLFDSRTRLTTHKASCIDRSISSNINSFAPRRIMDAAVLAYIVRQTNMYHCIHFEELKRTKPTHYGT